MMEILLSVKLETEFVLLLLLEVEFLFVLDQSEATLFVFLDDQLRVQDQRKIRFKYINSYQVHETIGCD